jgi:hypothetical protein
MRKVLGKAMCGEGACEPYHGNDRQRSEECKVVNILSQKFRKRGNSLVILSITLPDVERNSAGMSTV